MKKLQINEEKNKWNLYIQQVGIQKAYNDFKNVYNQSDPFVQHPAMHMMGSLLYETEGMRGIAICDDTFAFGCYHGFFGKAVQTNGLSNIKEMDLSCRQYFPANSSGCQHGIGHGVLAYLGDTKLSEALKICDTIQKQNAIDGCKGGIFMEYNFNNITHSSGNSPRKLNNSSPYYLCSELDQAHQYSCYYSQPEWWNSIYHGNYKKIGDLCEQLSSTNKEICFLGAGSIAIRSSKFDIDETIRKCNQIASVNGSMLCKAEARWRLLIFGSQVHANVHRADDFCNVSLVTLKDFCFKNSVPHN